jgi:hypothetical protein
MVSNFKRMSVHIESVVVCLQSYSAEPVNFINTPGSCCVLVCGGGDAPSSRCQVPLAVSNISTRVVCVEGRHGYLITRKVDVPCVRVLWLAC